MRDKSHYSYLIAFARQLESALTEDRDGIAADALDTLGSCLEVLLAAGDEPLRGDPVGPSEGLDDEDDDGDEPPLGGDIDEGPSRRSPAAVDEPGRIVGGLAATTAGRKLLARQRRGPALLMPRAQRRGKLKGGKRRGKK